MKKFSILLLLSFTVATQARASGPENIHGVGGRLESLTCHGAYVATVSDADRRIFPRVESDCAEVRGDAEVEACYGAVIRQLARPAPGAVFVGKAVEGDKSFQMSIRQNGRTVFNSLRTGFHGDGVDGTISLIFSRAGGIGGEFMIETGPLSEDMRHTTSLNVPVKRRMAADLVYFFIDGCTLDWTGQ